MSRQTREERMAWYVSGVKLTETLLRSEFPGIDPEEALRLATMLVACDGVADSLDNVADAVGHIDCGGS